MTQPAEARIAAVLGDHVHYGAGECRCGWGKDADPAKSIEQFWEHQAAVIAALPDPYDRVRQLEADLADAHRDAMVNRDTANRAHAVIDRVVDVLDDYDHLGPEAASVASPAAWMLTLRAALDAGEGQ